MKQRLMGLVLVALLSLTTALGCVPTGGQVEVDGEAVIVFDGVTVGTLKRSEVRCLRLSNGEGPWLIVTRAPRFTIGGDRFQDWLVPGSQRVELHLQISPRLPRPANVRFAIGQRVYRSRSETPTEVRPTWEDGHAIFAHVPLVEGSSYRGKEQLDRLVIRWTCFDE